MQTWLYKLAPPYAETGFSLDRTKYLYDIKIDPETENHQMPYCETLA
jgi:hypothetical protein